MGWSGRSHPIACREGFDVALLGGWNLVFGMELKNDNRQGSVKSVFNHSGESVQAMRHWVREAIA